MLFRSKKYNIAEPKEVKPTVTPLTPERKAEIESKLKALNALKEESINSKGNPALKNRDLKKEIKQWNEMVKKQKVPNKVSKASLAKREKQFAEYNEKRKAIIKNAKGGVLKLGGGKTITQQVTTGPTTFSHISKPAGMIDFNERNQAGEIFKGENYEKL